MDPSGKQGKKKRGWGEKRRKSWGKWVYYDYAVRAGES